MAVPYRGPGRLIAGPVEPYYTLHCMTSLYRGIQYSVAYICVLTSLQEKVKESMSDATEGVERHPMNLLSFSPELQQKVDEYLAQFRLPQDVFTQLKNLSTLELQDLAIYMATRLLAICTIWHTKVFADDAERQWFKTNAFCDFVSGSVRCLCQLLTYIPIRIHVRKFVDW